MRGVNKTGILLGKNDENKLKNIEKWPLLKEYALGDIGVGFFSMAHSPVDITQRINGVYKSNDKFSL